jgi:hypothetical protein
MYALCYTVCMSNKADIQVVRLVASDVEWREFRAAGVLVGMSAGELLGELIRQFLSDPKRSPMVRVAERVGAHERS